MDDNTVKEAGIVSPEQRTAKVLKILKGKFLLILSVALLLVLSLGLGIYKVFITSKNPSDTNEIPTINMNGKEYKAYYQTVEGLNAVQPPKNIDYQALATNLEQKLIEKPGSSSDYLELAQLYLQSGNTEKAITNYEKAKLALDPKAKDYQENIKIYDGIIAKLRGASQ